MDRFLKRRGVTKTWIQFSNNVWLKAARTHTHKKRSQFLQLSNGCESQGLGGGWWDAAWLGAVSLNSVNEFISSSRASRLYNLNCLQIKKKGI